VETNIAETDSWVELS